MDWIDGMQRAINYIEDNLCGEINLDEAARVSYLSSYSFQRTFSILCGLTVGEYIRMRRLTLAGAELAAEKIKVIDAALKYGYDSPDSFAKAFARFHGITPSQARNRGSKLRSFSRLTVKLSLEGGTLMNYKIEEKSMFTVTGVKTHFEGAPSKRQQNQHDLFVKGETRFVRYAVQGMARDCEREYCVISGVDDEGYDLLVGAAIPEYFNNHLEKTAGRFAQELSCVNIPKQIYVVAETSRGVNFLNEYFDVRRAIVGEWLPSSGYVLADAPEVSVFHWFPKEQRGNEYAEVWLPITKK